MYGDFRDRILEVFYAHITEVNPAYWNDLRNYLLHGTSPGSTVLKALVKSSHAESEGDNEITLLRFIWIAFPSRSYGSLDNVTTWMNHKGLNRLHNLW